ncbi:germination protein, Ger(x)C family [Clostridium cochlearium]|uniref:Germination protein, Ger(X)C family n=1 Tax=Clostridium cochlearium TaxID=1494 RepID=A0ABY0QIQ9_CLOCO|nr:Ger(x)C family spore germination protein [Clostridium cochlearium]SDK89630.1 germination protein, Ger(x)C family [Clostridium cochlearium]
MKKRIISIILCISTLFSGCYSYKDINKVLFVTSFIVDIDDNNEPILYLETFKPYRSNISGSEKGERIIYKGTGKTIHEVIRNIGLSSSFRLDGTQSKSIIFTTKAAEYGIDNFIDFFDRHQESLIRQYIAIYEGDVEKLLETKIKSEEYIGLFLVDLIDNIKVSSRAVELSMNDYLNKRTMGNRTCVMTLIKLDKNQIENLITIDGGAIIKEDKMIGKLPKSQSQSYNFLLDNVKGGTLEISNYEKENKFITLQILKSKTKNKIKKKDNVVELIKEIKVKTTLTGTQSRLNFTEEELNKIKTKAESNIKKFSEEVFNKYKNQNIDIFGVADIYKRKYPKEDSKNILKNTILKVEVDVKIEGSSNKLDYQ